MLSAGCLLYDVDAARRTSVCASLSRHAGGCSLAVSPLERASNSSTLQWLLLGCRYGADAISYAFSLAKGSTGCEADAIGQLVDMLEQVRNFASPGSSSAQRGMSSAAAAASAWVSRLQLHSTAESMTVLMKRISRAGRVRTSPGAVCIYRWGSGSRMLTARWSPWRRGSRLWQMRVSSRERRSTTGEPVDEVALQYNAACDCCCVSLQCSLVQVCRCHWQTGRSEEWPSCLETYGAARWGTAGPCNLQKQGHSGSCDARSTGDGCPRDTGCSSLWARSVVNADACPPLTCRSMFFAEDLTWNVRDTHMTDTATHLNEYLSTQRKIQRPKIAICASFGCLSLL